jgi:hypothetical protein
LIRNCDARKPKLFARGREERDAAPNPKFQNPPFFRAWAIRLLLPNKKLHGETNGPRGEPIVANRLLAFAKWRALNRHSPQTSNEGSFFLFISFHFFSLFFCFFKIKNNRPTARRRVRRGGFVIIYLFIIYIYIFRFTRAAKSVVTVVAIVCGQFRGGKEAQSQCRHIWTMGFPACRQKIG